MFEPSMIRRLCLPLLSIVLLSSAPAQTPAPTATQAILAGKLIDVRTGEVRSHAYILVAGDRVLSVGEAAPAGSQSVTLIVRVPADAALEVARAGLEKMKEAVSKAL